MYVELYLKIGKLMEKHGFTNQGLADASGVPVGTISGIRSGNIRSPGYDAICAMLSAMGEPASALAEAEDVPEAEPPPTEHQTIMRQAVQIASLSARLDAHDESAERYVGRCAKLEAELAQERRKNARLQNALVITLVVIVVLMVVYIWDVSNLHSGMTAFFNK